jgi:hypothetical protein
VSGEESKGRIDIDISEYFIPINYDEQVKVRQEYVRIAVRKPNKNEFFRVHPEWQVPAMIWQDGDKETYFCRGAVAENIKDWLSRAMILACVNQQGTPFAWPLKSSLDGKPNAWLDSARAVAETAVRQWVQLLPNQNAGSYEQRLPPPGVYDTMKPRWPDLSLQEFFTKAFKDRMIDRDDHPVILKLLGIAV